MVRAEKLRNGFWKADCLAGVGNDRFARGAWDWRGLLGWSGFSNESRHSVLPRDLAVTALRREDARWLEMAVGIEGLEPVDRQLQELPPAGIGRWQVTRALIDLQRRDDQQPGCRGADDR